MTFRLIIDGRQFPDGLPHASGYYRTFPREPSPVSAMTFTESEMTVLTGTSLDSVMDEILKLGSAPVVMLVCHAYSSGLAMGLARGTNATGNVQNLDTIGLVITADAEATRIRKLPDGDARIAAWQALFQQKLNLAVGGTFTNDEAETYYGKWLDMVGTRFGFAPARSALLAFCAKVQKVRDLKIDRLELRACELGSDRTAMGKVKTFFGCGTLVAPAVRPFFLPPTPVWTMSQFAAHVPAHGARGGAQRPGPHGTPTPDPTRLASVSGGPTTRAFDPSKPPATVAPLAPATQAAVDALPGIHVPGAPSATATAPPATAPVVVRVDETAPSSNQFRGYIGAVPDASGATPDWAKVRAFVERFIMPGSKYASGAMPLMGLWTAGRPGAPFLLPNEADYLTLLTKV